MEDKGTKAPRTPASPLCMGFIVSLSQGDFSAALDKVCAALCSSIRLDCHSLIRLPSLTGSMLPKDLDCCLGRKTLPKTTSGPAILKRTSTVPGTTGALKNRCVFGKIY